MSCKAKKVDDSKYATKVYNIFTDKLHLLIAVSSTPSTLRNETQYSSSDRRWLHPCSDTSKIVVTTTISFMKGCCWQGRYSDKGYWWISWNHHFEQINVATMAIYQSYHRGEIRRWRISKYATKVYNIFTDKLHLLIAMCHKWTWICSICRNHNPLIYHSWCLRGLKQE
jgi:hypothetical protein